MSSSILQAITLLREIASDMRKEAALDSLKSEGIIDDNQAGFYAEKFAGTSEEAALLAADVLRMSGVKSASFGKAVTGGEGAATTDDSGNRYLEHDLELLSLNV